MQTADKRTALPFIFVLAIAFLSASANSTGAWPMIHHLQFDDDFASGALDAWQFPYPEDWVIGSDGPLHFLHMLRNREPLVPRRPMQFALLRAANVGSFRFQARVRRESSSLLMVFNYVDTLHFYYTHLSADPGVKTRTGTPSGFSAMSIPARLRCLWTRRRNRGSKLSTTLSTAGEWDWDRSTKPGTLRMFISFRKMQVASPASARALRGLRLAQNERTAIKSLEELP